MPNLNPGDLVTFPLRGDKYGVALLVHVDDLALNDLYHFVVCDAVIDGTAVEGFDELGMPLEREHDAADVESAPPLIDHIGLTRHGLDTSDIVVVGSREVGEEDLRGYHQWLHLRYEDAVRRGIMRERVDDHVDEEYAEESDGLEENEESDEVEERSEAEDSETEVSETEVSETETEVDVDAPPATSLGVHDVPIGLALLRHRPVFEREAYRASKLGSYVMGLADDTAAIDAIIERLLGGDFGAGDELIDYGDEGMRRLGERLAADADPQTADDILQVLVNSGENAGYERVARFMDEHGTDPADPLYASAVRAFCYAVMITAGEPEVLKERLAMLESINDPELADDVRSAREALAGEG
jgi:hypothetical protein